MRRRDREMKTRAAREELLRAAPVCRIGLAPPPGPAGGGYPYIVPVHFVYSDGRIYVHSAREGRKIDILGENPRVCVEIDEYLGLISAERACGYGSRYRSLIAYGTARVVEAEAGKRRALELLMKKYTGRTFDFPGGSLSGVGIIEIRLEGITGKQAD